MHQTVSVRLDGSKVEALNGIAEQQNYSRNAIMEEAIDNYLEMNAAWVKGIEDAIKEADAGLAMPAKEVFERVRNEFWKLN